MEKDRLGYLPVDLGSTTYHVGAGLSLEGAVPTTVRYPHRNWPLSDFWGHPRLPLASARGLLGAYRNLHLPYNYKFGSSFPCLQVHNVTCQCSVRHLG